MQNLVRSYSANAPLIEKFILTSLGRVSLKVFNTQLAERLYKTFPSLELVYKCDEGFVQNSPNIYTDHEEGHHVGVDRAYLVDEVAIQKGYHVSEPYISTATGHLCITVVYAVGDGYLFLDFRVRSLLERFDLIEKNDVFKRINRSSYAVIGGGLLFFGVFVVLYGFYTFATSMSTAVSVFGALRCAWELLQKSPASRGLDRDISLFCTGLFFTFANQIDKNCEHQK